MTELSILASAEAEMFEALVPDIGLRALELEVDGVAMRTRVGEIGEGDPVLLLHGGGGGLGHWAPLLPHLANRRLIAVERPGCGQASRFDYAGIDLHQHACGFVGAALDALEIDSCDLIANSMGGLWSLWFASDYPDRVNSLTLVGTPAIFPGTSAPELMLQAAGKQPPALADINPPNLEEERKKLRLTGHGDALERGRIPPVMLNYLAALKCRPYFARDFHALISHCIDEQGAVPGAGISLEDIAALPQPTLVIWGERDTYGSVEQGRHVAEQMRNARFEVVPNAGHIPWLDNPELTAGWINEFLAKV